MRKIGIICFILAVLLPLSTTVNSSIITNSSNVDIDPLVDLTVTVEIKAIRFLENDDSGKLKSQAQMTMDFRYKLEVGIEIINKIRFFSSISK